MILTKNFILNLEINYVRDIKIMVPLKGGARVHVQAGLGRVDVMEGSRLLPGSVPRSLYHSHTQRCCHQRFRLRAPDTAQG